MSDTPARNRLYDYGRPAPTPARTRPPLVSVAITDEEKFGVAPAMDRPEYPYELCLRPTSATIEKLGMKGALQVGDILDLRAFARVTSVSETSSEWQIESMSADNEMTEDDNG